MESSAIDQSFNASNNMTAVTGIPGQTLIDVKNRNAT